MKKQLIIIFSAVLLTAGIGCSKGYLDVNDNPNSATSTTPELVLPQALTVTASGQIADGHIGSYEFLSEWMGYWCQSGSYAISSSDNSSYVQTSAFGNDIWTKYYHNLEDYDFIEQQAISQNKPFYQATAIVMKAYVFQQMVDMFNNIPYSQAFKGTAVVQPKYDSAKSIYESLSSRLDTAVTLLKNGNSVSAANSDVLVFNNATGTNSDWIKFANTLKLRILLRQSQMSGRTAYIQGEIAKILLNGGGFLTKEVGVNPGYANNTGQLSPFWGYCYNISGTFTQDRIRAANYPIAFCKNNNDPRYTYLYAPVNDSLPKIYYFGNILGSITNRPGNDASTFGPGVLKSASQTAILLSAAESNFLQAEAGLKGYLSNDPLTLFQNGVQASFTYLGAGDATSYYGQAGNKNTNYAACTTDAERLACIIRQKWMAMNSVTPFEAWCDYRRLGLPADVPITVNGGADVLAIPVRILYPSSEAQTNAANVDLQGAINHHTSKIFWMP